MSSSNIDVGVCQVKKKKKRLRTSALDPFKVFYIRITIGGEIMGQS